ncbi:receptor kinase-like protein Xa21 [Rosa sericea]
MHNIAALTISFFMENPRTLIPFGLVVLLHYSFFLHPATTSSSNFTDQSALLAIQSKLTFDPTETVLGGNWSTKTSFCDWIGVSCSKRRQRVTALDLSSMGLEGTIAPHVGNLSFLVILVLQSNSFSGIVPNEIRHLHRLRVLVLEANRLEGHIPPTLYHCQKLEIIALAENNLTGRIPEELGFLPKLQKLYLGLNNLAAGEIPASLGNVSTLQELSVAKSGLTGSLPASTLLNLSSLVVISLYINNISGVLPEDLCHYWPNIQHIDLSGNKLGGQLSSRFDQCSNIQELSLSYNRFVGTIPKVLASLQHLEVLYLGGNGLTGTVPPVLGNLSNLQKFAVQHNNIRGSIPRELGLLSNLLFLSLAINSLTGAIPLEIFNITSLQTLSVHSNSLSGAIPSYSGVVFPNLESLYFDNKKITGLIPSFFSNLTKLNELGLGTNLLYGPIPMNLGSLKHLRYLNLARNQLTGEPGAPELKFLSSLFNSTSLRELVLNENPLNGIIPNSFGNFSSLQQIYALGCQIKGHIPRKIHSLKSLIYLSLVDNNISGKIPPQIGGLERLQRLYLSFNKIEGSIPYEICHLQNLGELSLENNKISGLIPNCIANLSRTLQKFLLNSNQMTSLIPMNLLWNLENLLVLNLSSNSFSGDIPTTLTKLISIEVIDLSHNQITGNISSIIAASQSVAYLDLSKNWFIGSIPPSCGDLKGLEYLDLSYNNLSGAIPKSLETLKYLEYLNLSFNNLFGEIPSGGPFVNFSSRSFLENKALCGRPKYGVPPCMTQKSKTTHPVLTYVLPSIASTVFLIALIYMITWYRKRKRGKSTTVEQLTTVEHSRISYQELRRATNDFCESNYLGGGSFGSVYKGILSNGTTIAVKILKLEMEGAVKSFDAECKVWRTIRHRNLVKVITTCSSPDVRALVLQYMSNGSLEKWLYSHNYCLSILQRVSMLIDIAFALEYLHHGQAEAVVHCDVKPGNILLDEDMVAHVADFGLAKILAKNKEETQTRTIGTLGYVAPEYGSAGKVSKKGDVYSFGIMMLEIMARKKPTDEMFAGEVTLRQCINVSIPDNVLEVVDAGLLSIEEGRDMNATESILASILEIGLRCSEEVAEDRMDIKDVVPKLKKIKLALQH